MSGMDIRMAFQHRKWRTFDIPEWPRAYVFKATALAFAAVAATFAADEATIRDLKPGDFVRVECRWRNVDVPHTASVRPSVSARDASGRLTYLRRVSGCDRRGFVPDDRSVERWQLNYLVGGGAKSPPSGAEVTFTTLSSNTVSMAASISAEGDSAVFRDAEVSIVKCELKSRGGIGRRPPLEWDGHELTDAELDAALARREIPRTEVFRDGDRTVMRLNGRPFFPRIFKLTKYDSVQRSKLPAAFSEEGFNVFIAPMLVGGRERPETNSVWRQDGSIDVSIIRGELRRYLRWNPDVNLMVNLVMQAPRGWGRRHPAECFRTDDGDYAHWFHHRVRAYGKTPEPTDPNSLHTAAPSYASEVWAADMADAAARIVSWLGSAPEGRAVVGIYFSGGTDGQWLDLFDNHMPERQAADCSDVARRRFAEFRRAKYGRQDVDVRIPTAAEFWNRERCHYAEHASTPMSDYCEFSARAATELRLKVARGIKRGSRGRLLVGSYSPNGGLEGYPLISVTYAKGLLESPD